MPAALVVVPYAGVWGTGCRRARVVVVGAGCIVIKGLGELSMVGGLYGWCVRSICWCGGLSIPHLSREEEKIVRGRSYVSSMYAGVGNGGGLWDGMGMVWQSHDTCRGSCLLALGGRASVSVE